MSSPTNTYGQPIGPALPHWSARERPGNVTLEGRFCRLEPLSASRHAASLYDAYAQADDPRDWTYMFVGPFENEALFLQYMSTLEQSQDPKHYAVIDAVTGKAVGSLSLMRIEPTHGVIEVGHVMFSPLMKQKPASTEAQFLLMRYVFDVLKYRRYEWKCDSLNAPSRKTAQRLGFSFEGIFRQAVVYKGRSRDTAWFSIIDSEWPAIGKAFVHWLSPSNFDDQGQQVQSLSSLRSAGASTHDGQAHP
ncbi:GNAT family protein [Dyella sp. C11]|uniref:GNAT family N-acetyltransferase n=1 Tax=Dyella sp. C11 TaxID=2126991 RepID=UPI000D6433BE|nr:GNAT family protein [Dyella sp. C11]